MMYTVKTIYYTLQGEGAQTGRPAVFLRFAGCNLWSGREDDRLNAVCKFCDTDFIGTDGAGGGKFSSPRFLARMIAAEWTRNAVHELRQPLVVCTGGEPLLQLDESLISELHAEGFEVAVETNGTALPPSGIDWICCSPKIGAELLLRVGNELKLVYPQANCDPEQFLDLDFLHFFLQPMDGPSHALNTELAMQYCNTHPRWQLSLQTQKILKIP